MLDFSVNTNPLGMPGAVRDAIRDHVDDYARYPDALCGELRAALARHEGVSEEAICCGNGAADLIFRLCLALRPRHTLITAPAFSEYERAALLAGSRVSRHVLRAENDFTLEPAFLDDISGGVDLVMLCNPNNPTGRLVESALLTAILERCRETGARLVVDECFLPFTHAPSLAGNAAPHLAVLKALTKTYSLAGIRLGYLIAGDSSLAAKIMDTGQAWSVSAVAQYAGCAALKIPAWVDEARRLIEAERPRIMAELRAFGCTAVNSDANFILFRCETPLLLPLIERGILIRTCDSFHGLDGGWYRAGIKRRDENDRLLAALRAILGA
jgi:threonine-phosphate decarboxylase